MVQIVRSTSVEVSALRTSCPWSAAWSDTSAQPLSRSAPYAREWACELRCVRADRSTSVEVSALRTIRFQARSYSWMYSAQPLSRSAPYARAVAAAHRWRSILASAQPLSRSAPYAQLHRKSTTRNDLGCSFSSTSYLLDSRSLELLGVRRRPLPYSNGRNHLETISEPKVILFRTW